MTNESFLGGLMRGEMAADHFFIMTNAAGRDPELHLADRGLLADMISHAQGFVITEASLAARCKDGVKTVRACLKRLRARGYVYRGERLRYPAGTKNAKGKDISGALGPYRWYVTDKPEEIAAILTQYAKEQRAANLAAEHIAAGQDYRPEWEVVPDHPVDNSALPAEPAASPDQAERGEHAGDHNRPVSTALKGRTKEDQREEDQVENQGGLACGSETGRAALGRAVTPSAAAVDGPLGTEFVDQPQTARASADPLRWHGPGGLAGLNSPAANNARNSIVSGKRGPNWSQTKDARKKLDPAIRAAVRDELASRPAGPPRATGLPQRDDQRSPVGTPPEPPSR